MGFHFGSLTFPFGLTAALLVAVPSYATLPVQVTEDHSVSGCSSEVPVASETASILAWQSDCNPAASNSDGSREIFRSSGGAAPTQLTSGSSCSSARPVISADGSRIAFESDCNLAGANADGNFEIFLWKNGSVSQLTISTGCDNLDPSINAAGTSIAFDSTCNIAGTNNSGRGSEIFLVSSVGVLQQLTVDPDGGACDSTSPSINAAGDLVAFDSDCDLTGQNPDLALEIFTVTPAAVVKQRTFAQGDYCSSARPSISGDAALIAFTSDCDFLAKNTDRSDEIFTVDSVSALRQVSNAGADAACASGEARMASSGRGLTFSSYCNPGGSNADGSIEVFHAGAGKAVGGILAVSSGSGCSSLAGGLSAEGTRVSFDSDCNPVGSNGDGGVEIFQVPACVCGAPFTRKLPPKVSDALSTLRTAVGAAKFAACECDVNKDATIGTTDALRVLKASIGQIGIVLDCPAP